MANIRKVLKIEDVYLWYLVGLIAPDGCLYSDGRHVDITAKEQAFLQLLRKRIGISHRVGIKNRNTNNQAYRIQIANKNFYDFLLSTGLTAKKSRSLGKLNVPPVFFNDFLRGLIDGDGSLRHWVHPTNLSEQWSLRIYSGSREFLEWLEYPIAEFLKAKGRIHQYNKQGTCYVLKFGKMAARKIVQQCYYKNCLSLYRKYQLAQECVSSYVGWEKSKTVDCVLNN